MTPSRSWCPVKSESQATIGGNDASGRPGGLSGLGMPLEAQVRVVRSCGRAWGSSWQSRPLPADVDAVDLPFLARGAAMFRESALARLGGWLSSNATLGQVPASLQSCWTYYISRAPRIDPSSLSGLTNITVTPLSSLRSRASGASSATANLRWVPPSFTRPSPSRLGPRRLIVLPAQDSLGQGDRLMLDTTYYYLGQDCKTTSTAGTEREELTKS